MTAHERVLYDPFVGAIELREGIVRRAGVALTRAMRLRNAIGILATLAAGFEAAELFAPVPWFELSSSRHTAITLAFGGAWLLAAVNAWCCRQRVEDTRARLIEYIAHLPIAT
jgi:hypothetical protein